MMQVQTMEFSLSNELLEGEELLWSGRPTAGGRSIVSPARVLWIIGLIYGLLGLAALVLCLILVLAVGGLYSSGRYLGLLIPGGIFFLMGLIFLIVGATAKFVPRTIFYAITNRRVIILRGGRYTRVTSCDVRAITQVQRFERPDGSGDLVFSGILGGTLGVYNNNTSSTMYNLGRQNALTAIPNVRQVEQKLLGVMGGA